MPNVGVVFKKGASLFKVAVYLTFGVENFFYKPNVIFLKVERTLADGGLK